MRIFSSAFRIPGLGRPLSRVPDIRRAAANSVGTADELSPVMARIAATLHNQYVLGYYPGDNDHSGKFRPISVELRVPRGVAALRIYARAGYYTPQR